MSDYPTHAGFVRGSDTSQAAALASDRGARSTQQRRTLTIAVEREPEGITGDDLERITGWPHQSCSARMRELVLLGLLYDSEQRRLTRYGRRAVVRRPTERGLAKAGHPSYVTDATG